MVISRLFGDTKDLGQNTKKPTQDESECTQLNVRVLNTSIRHYANDYYKTYYE